MGSFSWPLTTGDTEKIRCLPGTATPASNWKEPLSPGQNNAGPGDSKRNIPSLAAHHGLQILVLVAVATSAAAAIYLTQRRRYRTSSHSISHEPAEADLPAVLSTAFASWGLGLLGVAVVLTP